MRKFKNLSLLAFLTFVFFLTSCEKEQFENNIEQENIEIRSEGIEHKSDNDRTKLYTAACPCQAKLYPSKSQPNMIKIALKCSKFINPLSWDYTITGPNGYNNSGTVGGGQTETVTVPSGGTYTVTITYGGQIKCSTTASILLPNFPSLECNCSLKTKVVGTKLNFATSCNISNPIFIISGPNGYYEIFTYPLPKWIELASSCELYTVTMYYTGINGGNCSDSVDVQIGIPC